MNLEKLAIGALMFVFILTMTSLIIHHRERMKELDNESKINQQMQYPLADSKPWYKIL